MEQLEDGRATDQNNTGFLKDLWQVLHSLQQLLCRR
jgi:hypothetical protein